MTKRHLSVLLLVGGSVCIGAGVWLALGAAWALIAVGVMMIGGELLVP